MVRILRSLIGNTYIEARLMSPFVLSNRFEGDRDAAASLDRPFNANFKRQD